MHYWSKQNWEGSFDDKTESGSVLSGSGRPPPRPVHLFARSPFQPALVVLEDVHQRIAGDNVRDAATLRGQRRRFRQIAGDASIGVKRIASIVAPSLGHWRFAARSMRLPDDVRQQVGSDEGRCRRHNPGEARFLDETTRRHRLAHNVVE